MATHIRVVSGGDISMEMDDDVGSDSGSPALPGGAMGWQGEEDVDFLYDDGTGGRHGCHDDLAATAGGGTVLDVDEGGWAVCQQWEHRLVYHLCEVSPSVHSHSPPPPPYQLYVAMLGLL